MGGRTSTPVPAIQACCPALQLPPFVPDYKPDALVWSSEGGAAEPSPGAAAPAPDGFYLVVSGVVRHTYTSPSGASSEQLQGVGAMFGELAGLCGSRLPGEERVVACGNSFGRGPLVYRFPASALAALRQR